MVFAKLLLLCGVLVLANAADPSDKDACNLNLAWDAYFWDLAIINEPKDDDMFDEIFYKFNLPDAVTDWELDMDHNAKYVQAEVLNRTVVFKPTQAFRRFEYEQHSTKPIDLMFRLAFRCGEDFFDKTEFDFIQRINDVNNHAPRFNREIYKYHFGMPIKSGAPLTSIMEIYAVDVDYTNPQVNFTINSDDLKISYKGRDEQGTKKIHYARLDTTREFSKGVYEFIITATDEGTPQKSGTARVQLVID